MKKIIYILICIGSYHYFISPETKEQLLSKALFLYKSFIAAPEIKNRFSQHLSKEEKKAPKRSREDKTRPKWLLAQFFKKELKKI